MKKKKTQKKTDRPMNSIDPLVLSSWNVFIVFPMTNLCEIHRKQDLAFCA